MSNFLLEAGRQTLMLELQEASRLPERLGDDFIRAAETIIHCEGKLVVSGIGKSGHIGKKLAATFASTGTPAFFVHPAEALHGDLGMLDSRDVMLFISYSGSAKELDLIIPRLEDKSVALLAMTGKPTSPLGLAAKAVLDISVEREACPMHLAPTSSTVNTLMMGDALAMAVMQARGFNEEDFARSHPAGALGARLLEQILAMKPAVDAIFFCNDDLAQGALLAAQRLRLAVPKRLAIVGFNDLTGSDQMVPALTTVRTPRGEIGQRAAQMLLTLMRGGTPPERCVDVGFELVVRESS